MTDLAEALPGPHNTKNIPQRFTKPTSPVLPPLPTTSSSTCRILHAEAFSFWVSSLFYYITQTLLHNFLDCFSFIIIITLYLLKQSQGVIYFPSTMDSLASVSPSMVLPSSNPLHLRRLLIPNSSSFSSHNHRLLPRLSTAVPLSKYYVPSRRRRWRQVSCKFTDGGPKHPEEAEEDDGREDVERALHLDGTIPGSSNEFVKQVSSRAYDMRRHLQQSFDSSSYDGNNSTVQFYYFAWIMLLIAFSCFVLIKSILLGWCSWGFPLLFNFKFANEISHFLPSMREAILFSW